MQASLGFKGLLRFREFIASRANQHIRLGRMRMPINRAAVNARTITMGRGSRPVVLDWRCGPSFSKMSYIVAEFKATAIAFAICGRNATCHSSVMGGGMDLAVHPPRTTALRRL